MKKGAFLVFSDFQFSLPFFANKCECLQLFARAKTNGIYFDNNWAYGQKVTQADFESWIKNHEENL